MSESEKMPEGVKSANNAGGVQRALGDLNQFWPRMLQDYRRALDEIDRQKARLQWALSNFCEKHADIQQMSNGPCPMCESETVPEALLNRQNHCGGQGKLCTGIGVGELLTVDCPGCPDCKEAGDD